MFLREHPELEGMHMSDAFLLAKVVDFYIKA